MPLFKKNKKIEVQPLTKEQGQRFMERLRAGMKKIRNRPKARYKKRKTTA